MTEYNFKKKPNIVSCNKPWVLALSHVFVLTCNGDNSGRQREDLKQFACKSNKMTIRNNPAVIQLSRFL